MTGRPITITPAELRQELQRQHLPITHSREAMMRARNPGLAAGRRQHQNGRVAEMYHPDGAFVVTVALQLSAFGITWFRARELAEKVLEDLRHFRRHNVSLEALTPMQVLLPPPGGDDRAPQFIFARASAVDPEAIAASLSAGGILITLPAVAILQDFCRTFSDALDVAVSIDDVLAAPTPTVTTGSVVRERRH